MVLHACRLVGPWFGGKKQSASRSFERLALGRTYESYISVRKGCSKGCPSHSKPLSVHILLHRCPVGAACPCLAHRDPVGVLSCLKGIDRSRKILRRRPTIREKRHPANDINLPQLGSTPPKIEVTVIKEHIYGS